MNIKALNEWDLKGGARFVVLFTHLDCVLMKTIQFTGRLCTVYILLDMKL